MLSGGMPGKYKEDYPNGYPQYLLDAETWGRALREFAKRHPGEEVAFQACTKILDTPMPRAQGKAAHAVRALRRQATDILLRDFVDRKELCNYVHAMVNAERANSRKVAQRLIDDNTHPEVAGVAMWLLSQVEGHRDTKRLETIRDKYGKVPYFNATLRDEAVRAIRVMKYYTHGKVPRDIVATSLDGREVKLSDYKGKVVVLYFWATWSTGKDGVAERMDQLNRIARTLKDRPFQVLGVAMDDEPTAKETIAKAKTNWPNWYDGSRGPIATEWGIRGRKLVLIDHTGKILDHDVSAFGLGDAIAGALRAVEK